MDEEALENQAYQAKRIEQLGFMNEAHFREFLFQATQGLNFSVDQFSNRLGVLALACDFERTIKLLWAFKDVFEFAAMSWRMHEAKQKALAEQDVNDG